MFKVLTRWPFSYLECAMFTFYPVGYSTIWNVHCFMLSLMGIQLSEMCHVCSRFSLLGIQLSGMCIVQELACLTFNYLECAMFKFLFVGIQLS